MMGELDLDKIERTFPGITGKKYDLESVRISSGRMQPKHSTIIRRDLTGTIQRGDRKFSYRTTDQDCL